MVVRGDDIDEAVPCFEDTGWRRVPGVPTRASWADFPLAQAVRLDAALVVMEIGIQQREIEELSATRSGAPEQRRANRPHRMDAGADVTQSDHRRIWRAAFLAAHRNHAGVRRAESIEAWLVGERTGLSES